ncbi:hypothetical protein HYQ44_017921 [Verticillium longisporum]|nr:hypothetical protein HYQ44_017921 [Verticillium longisporum]
MLTSHRSPFISSTVINGFSAHKERSHCLASTRVTACCDARRLPDVGPVVIGTSSATNNALIADVVRLEDSLVMGTESG